MNFKRLVGILKTKNLTSIVSYFLPKIFSHVHHLFHAFKNSFWQVQTGRHDYSLYSF